MDMSTLNQSFYFSYTEFVMLTFPGVSENRPLLILAFAFVYLASLMCNSLVSYTVALEKSLHTPMYVLIVLLLSLNIACTTTVMPKMLITLHGYTHISLASCLVQMFFVYVTVTLKSVALVLMALDRYIAICMPLRYHKIANKYLFLQLLLLGLLRNCVLTTLVVVLASNIKYCKSNLILTFVCEYVVLLGLGCGDISKLQVVGLTLRTVITAFDLGILLGSYIKVLHAAMKIAAGGTRQKALHTCFTHLLVAVVIYAFGLSTSIMYKVEKYISHDAQNLYSAIYFLLPATVNPIIYGLRVKEIKSFMMRRHCVKYRFLTKKTVVSVLPEGGRTQEEP
uniref:G-protein coupled receptors family 1 profile domain-containing protein n=1 Tax=Leptobrachium leishanense TaxID=445787 RepID=A0A8C5P9D0_9ANUR